VDYLRGVMMAASGNADLVEATAETRAAMQEISGQIDSASLYRAIRAFSHAASDLRSGWRPQLPLELALIDSVLDPCAGEAAAGAATPSSTAGTGDSPRATPTHPVPSAPAAKPAGKSSGAAPATRQATAESAPATGITIGRVRESWERVLGIIRERDPRSHTLFDRSQPDSLDGDLLSIVVESELVRQKCSRTETLLLLQGVLAEVLGSPMRIRFAVGKVRSVAEGRGKYPEGGMVDTASREFGAQVIDLP
jgi:hypothetical protein